MGFLFGYNPLFDFLKLDSMVGYDIHEVKGSNIEFCG